MRTARPALCIVPSITLTRALTARFFTDSGLYTAIENRSSVLSSLRCSIDTFATVVASGTTIQFPTVPSPVRRKSKFTGGDPTRPVPISILGTLICAVAYERAHVPTTRKQANYRYRHSIRRHPRDTGRCRRSRKPRARESERFGCVASPQLFEHHPGRLQQWKSDQTNDAGYGNKQWIVHLPAEQNCK